MNTKNLYITGFLLVLLTSCGVQESDTFQFDIPKADLEQVLEFSETDDVMLGAISAVRIDSDENIILVDGQLRKVHAIDSEGNYIQQIGASGSGPGEYSFTGPSNLGNDDSFHLLDFMTRSIISYDKVDNGWEHRSTLIVDFQDTGFIRNFYTDGDGEFYIETLPSFGEESDIMIVRKINSESEIVKDSLVTYPNSENFLVMVDNMPRMSFTSDEVHRKSVFSMDSQGYIYYGWTNELKIQRMHVDDDELQSFIQVAVPNSPFTDTDSERVMDNYSEMLSENPQARRDFRSSFPETKPAFRDFKVDNSGMVWVRIFADEGEPDWIVFSSEGEAVKSVAIPENQRLLTIHNGAIYTTSTNTDEELPTLRKFVY